MSWRLAMIGSVSPAAIPNERIPDRLRRIDVQVVPSIWYENAP